MTNKPVEIQSVSQWNTALKEGRETGATVVVDFHAVWCGPCKQIAPRYDSLAEKTSHVKFLRVDVDQQKAIAQKYQISAMPTFLAIKAGKVVETLKGADPAGLSRLVSKHAGPNPPIAPLPEQAEAAKEAGNIAFKDGKFEEAVKKYSEAIELAPTYALLYGNRSTAYLRLSPPDNPSALSDAKKGIELDPKWGKGYVRLADALSSGEEKVHALKKAVELLPDGLQKNETMKKLDEAKKEL